MRRAILTFALLTSAVPFGAALADEPLRSSFPTRASDATVLREGCSLDAHVRVGTADRPMDVTIVRGATVEHCPVTLGDGEPIHMIVTAAGGNVSVGFSGDTPPDEVMKPALAAISGELQRRLDAAAPAPPVETAPIRRTERASPTLTGVGIGVGVIGLIGFIVGTVGFSMWVADEADQCRQRKTLCYGVTDVGPWVGGMLAGFGVMLIGAGAVVLGERRVQVAAGRGVTIAF